MASEEKGRIVAAKNALKKRVRDAIIQLFRSILKDSFFEKMALLSFLFHFRSGGISVKEGSIP